MIDVCCIGLACVDEFYKTDGYPRENIKLEQYTEADRSGGGPAANAACLLAMWGVETAFAGRIGTNEYGSFIEDDFHRRGIKTDPALKQSDYISAHSVILVNTRNASRTIITVKDPRSSDSYFEGQSREDVIKKATLSYQFPVDWNPRAILVDGHEPALAAIAIESRPDAISVLDAGSLRFGTKLLAPLVDYVVASERFALQWSGIEALKTPDDYQLVIDRIKADIKGRLVITLGERGLIWEENGIYRHMPAFKVEAIDTTAAGDIFHGAFTYAVLNGMILEDALRLASLTAAISVERPGGRDSIPDPDTVTDRARMLPRPSENASDREPTVL